MLNRYLRPKNALSNKPPKRMLFVIPKSTKLSRLIGLCIGYANNNKTHLNLTPSVRRKEKFKVGVTIIWCVPFVYCFHNIYLLSGY